MLNLAAQDTEINRSAGVERHTKQWILKRLKNKDQLKARKTGRNIQHKVFCTATDYKPLMTLSGIASVFSLFYIPEISIYFKYINTLFIISKKNIYFPVVFLSQITRCYQWNDCDEQHAFIIRDQINKTLLQQSRHLWHTKFTGCIQQPRPALVWKSPYKSSPKRKV